MLTDIEARRGLFFRWTRGPLGGLVLVVLCCTVYVPGFFSIPPVDRDESRFAQASRQMFESVALPEADRDAELHAGGLAVPMVGGKPRLNKPPLIYWLQAGSAAVFTRGDPLADAIWMYRVPSLLAGVVTVLVTWRLGVSMFDPRTGWVAGALLAVAPVFVWEAHQARADMVMVAWTTLAMGQLWGIWKKHWTSSGGTTWSPLLLWIFVALGVLTKGPITPMVVVLTAVALSVLGRDFRWLLRTWPVLGVVIVAAGVGPWVYAVAQRVGFEAYWAIVQDEVFGRAGSAKEGHWGPPGYHVLLLVVLFWPGSLLTGWSVARAWRAGLRGRDRGGVESEEDGRPTGGAADRFLSRLLRVWRYFGSLRVSQPAEAFLLAWIVPVWLVFELVGTKLPHYTMPMYPAVAIVTARGLFAWVPSPAPNPGRARLGGYVWLAVGGVLLVGFWFGWLLTPGGVLSWVALLGVACAAYAMYRAFGAIRVLDFRETQGWSMLAAVPLLVAFVGAVAPGVFGLSRAAWRAASARAGERPITWVGFNEDSVTWLARGRPSFTPPDELVAWFADHADGLAIVSVTAEDSYRKHPMELHAVKFVFGVHYTKGRVEKLALVERLHE